MKNKTTFFKKLLINTMLILLSSYSFSQILPAGSSWSYLDDGSDQGLAWFSTGFDYSSWATGNAELGYGDGEETIVVGFEPSSGDKYRIIFFIASDGVEESNGDDERNSDTTGDEDTTSKDE